MNNLFGEPYDERKKQSPEEKQRRNWQNRFQRWCNSQAMDEATSLGICGYSDICDYCDDNSYGKPCVRALSAMLKSKNKKIDYNYLDFIDIWTGNYWRKEHNNE